MDEAFVSKEVCEQKHKEVDKVVKAVFGDKEGDGLCYQVGRIIERLDWMKWLIVLVVTTLLGQAIQLILQLKK